VQLAKNAAALKVGEQLLTDVEVDHPQAKERRL
jgi:hypothetical protein